MKEILETAAQGFHAEKKTTGGVDGRLSNTERMMGKLKAIIEKQGEKKLRKLDATTLLHHAR